MSNIPAIYAWITKIQDQPKLIMEGLKLVGVREYPGTAQNNPIIMKMADELTIPRSMYPNDETAWCALAMNWLCFKTGKPLSYTNAKKDKYDLLRAESFIYWGVESPLPMFGDVCVFKRPGGSHVGLYCAQDETHYHILGGNQGNAYGFARLEKTRLVRAQRFYAVGPPASVQPYLVGPDGTISKNEA